MELWGVGDVSGFLLYQPVPDSAVRRATQLKIDGKRLLAMSERDLGTDLGIADLSMFVRCFPPHLRLAAACD
jgi:hypothetical protein